MSKIEGAAAERASSILPDIPIENLFSEMGYPDPVHRTPQRWLSRKSAAEFLNVTIRTIDNYIKAGKVETKQKTVKGHKRIFVSNKSLIDIQDQKELA